MIKHNWTKEMDDIIRTKYGTLSHEDIIKILGVPFTPSAVRVRYSYLKVNTPKYAQVPKFYTKKDERFIINKYKTLTIKQIAEKLGVSQHALDKKISKMRHELPNGMELLKPHKNALPIGTIRNAKDSKTGNPFQMIKTEHGWKRIITRIRKEKAAKTPRPHKYTDEQREDIIKQVGIVGAKKVAEAYNITPRNLHGLIGYWRNMGHTVVVKRIHKEAKKPVYKPKPKVTSAIRRNTTVKPKEKEVRLKADISDKISVRLNSKTIIFVKPGTDIEKLKLKYA